jgi:hypothetical protein
MTIRERLDMVSDRIRSLAERTIKTALCAASSWAKTDPAQSAADKITKTNFFICHSSQSGRFAAGVIFLAVVVQKPQFSGDSIIQGRLKYFSTIRFL